MIDCYLLAVCRASSLDRDTNNFSLAHLIEEMQVHPEGFGQIVPFELHFYVQVAESLIGKTAEFRIVWREQAGAEVLGANSFTIDLTSARCRTRTAFLKLPDAPGNYRINLEWRPVTAPDWQRCSAFWPFELKPLDESALSLFPAAPSQPPST